MILSVKSGKTREVALLTAALLAAVSSLGCGGASTPNPQKAESVQGLRVQKVQFQTVPDEIEAPGSVVAVSAAEVGARTMGTVVQVAAREGDAVKRGQLLAQLDERELAARLSAAQAARQGATAGVSEATRAVALAQAQADVAQKTYERFAYLRDEKSVSPQEFDEVEAKQRAAQAGLEQAKARLEQAEALKGQAESEARAAESVASYTRIVAPFDGRVVRRMVEPGSLASPGLPLFVVEDTSRYQLEVTLPTEASVFLGASSLAVRRGSAARVQFDALPEKSFTGKVAEIEAGGDPSSHTLKARVDLSHDAAIQSGLFGRAWFARGGRTALVVTASSVVERGQLRGIYAVDANGLAYWRVVTLGRNFGNQVEVLSGLSDGDQIVVNPGGQELDGKKVAGAPEERHP